MTAKYIPPFGSTDPDASYENGNAEFGIEGSIADARAWEWPQREIIAALTAFGITPDGSVTNQLAAAIAAAASNVVIPGQFRTLATYPISSPSSGISVNLAAFGVSIRDFRLTYRIRGACDYISCRLSLDGGATFKTGSTDYTTSTWTNFNGSSAADGAFVRLTNPVVHADGFAMGTVNLTAGSSTSKAQFFAIGGTEYGVGYTGYANIEVAKLNTVGKATNILIYPESGNIPGDSLITLEGLSLP